MFAPNEAEFEFSVLVVTVKISIFWFTAVPQISLQTKVVPWRLIYLLSMSIGYKICKDLCLISFF